MRKISDSERTLAHFNLLIEEVLQGWSSRSRYQPWEIDLLLDIESCNLDRARAVKILPRYREAVRREMENGARLPLKLSQYLKATSGIPHEDKGGETG